MAGGIVAQYGFLYQRYVFLNTILENLGMNKIFVFEGVDDIDITKADDRIFGIADEKNKFIQVKSGKVSKQCFAKVIGNWMLEEKKLYEDGEKYNLILENEIQFDITDEKICDELIEIYHKAKSSKKNSICRRMYDKYEKEIQSKEFTNIVSNFIEQISVCVFTLEELGNTAESIFERTYCEDILIYDIAKKKRFERFEQYVYSEIDSAMKTKCKYSLDFTGSIRIISKCQEEISDKHYKVEFRQYREQKRDLAKKLVEESTMREVAELMCVNSDESFVINEIIKEMLYKEFREVYISPREMDISNIEQIAKENYDESKFKLGTKTNSHDLFYETIGKNIGSSLLENSPIYRNGCYAYLTGENIDEDLQITWRCVNG